MKTVVGLFVFFHVTLFAQCTPSIHIVENADPYQDARDIHAALHGPGTDESALRHILPYRSCAQRLTIKQAYFDLFNDDITRRIARDTSGTYEQVLKDCFLCGEYLMASFFERAITGKTDRHRKNKSVIEIMVTHTDYAQKKNDLLGAYQKLYGRSVEHDIRKHLSGDFENVLLEILARDRADSKGCDYDAAYKTAVALNNEVKHWGNHRDVLDTVVWNTAFDQANAIFAEFKRLNGHDLIAVVSHEMNHEKANTYEDGIHYIATYQNGHIEYYATRLKEATDGPGTDEQTIDRIILSHAEYDMKEIEDQFFASYHKKLISKIAHDTSGAYENFIKQFLTRPSNEMMVGLQVAQGIAERGLQRKMLAQQQLVSAQGHPMNQFPNVQIPQLPAVYV